MSAWLYQINQTLWSPERYRVEIWEGQDWAWPVGQKILKDHVPTIGDTLTFFYAPTGGSDPGFYGWAVILEWIAEGGYLRFRAVAPSDHLKMHPWWDEKASHLADEIRGKVKQGTLWLMSESQAKHLRSHVGAWLSGLLSPDL
jgi:hypothetical protein